MKHRNIALVLALVTVLVVSLFLVATEFSAPVQSASDEPFYVGVEIGWKANVTECKAFIDEVKNYTNLLILANGVITDDAAALNEACDYAYEAGMYFMVNFMYPSNYLRDPTNPYAVEDYPLTWTMKAKERYGDKFLGVYLKDELGGKELDSGRTPFPLGPDDTKSFGDAARYFVKRNSRDTSLFSYFGSPENVSLFIADFGLYWFDYKAGYNVVLGEFTMNNTRPLHLALCRGAATLQNKDWGIMITWDYKEPPYLPSGALLYDDLVFAYNSGANYVAVYDAWSDQHVNSTLTEDRLDALKHFWEYVQQNPDKHGSPKADTVLVLPENYGFGFRNPLDTIWGYTAADMYTEKMYDDVYCLLEEYGSRLDVVYSDPEFNDALTEIYSEVLTWTPGVDADMYPVVNLNTSRGYSTIQEAISSFATDTGHVIFVKAGVYHENLVINKGVTLMGEDRKTTIIDGGNVGTAVTLTRSYSYYSSIDDLTGVTVTGFTIRNGAVTALESTDSVPLFASGLNLTEARDCNIVGNDIVGNGVGVCIRYSSNNRFRDNTIENNALNFGVEGSSFSDYVNDVDSSNTVDGKPICYLVDEHDLAVPQDAGYVALVNCTNITATNLQLTNNYNGLLIAYTQNSTIIDNTLTNNWEGLNLVYSSRNVLSGNEMNDNTYAFVLKDRLTNDIDDTNTVDGKPIIYWIDQHDRTVPEDACYVVLMNCTGITIQNLQLTNNRQGILMINTRNTTITQNTITNQSSGIQLESSSDNTITNNFLQANTNYGICLVSSDNNLLVGNTLTGNSIGIYAYASAHNSIHRNNITANDRAIIFTSGNDVNSSYNTVTENNIALNENHIFTEPGANYNTIYHNNFLNNTQQENAPFVDNYPDPYFPILIDVINDWDNGSEGNYWSDYPDHYMNATEVGNSGIWDMHYYVDVIGVDNFPLVQPYPIPRLEYP